MSDRWRYSRPLAPETPTDPADVPLRTFQGHLRCLRPTRLNEIGKAVLENFFPNFANPTMEEALIRRLERAASGLPVPANEQLEKAQEIREAGLTVEARRHRRFAGGDGSLPRGCYYTLCDAAGDDGGTLSRELFEYRDKTLPGLVFVGDSFDEELTSSLGVRGLAYSEGHSGLVILVGGPPEGDELRAWQKQFATVLSVVGSPDDAGFCTVLTPTHEAQEISHVIDLRFPDVQEWCYRRFAQGELPWFYKPVGGEVTDFLDLLPTLVHVEYGGTGATHAIGTWMRAYGVNALIYPSARSDASVTFRGGELVASHGWDLIDYRPAQQLPPQECTVDGEPWHGFRQGGVFVERALPTSQARASWRVVGIEQEYAAVRGLLVDILRGGATGRAVEGRSYGQHGSF